MDFLTEVAKEFEGKCELGEYVLLIQFQHDKLQLETPVPVAVQYSENTATCRVFSYVCTDIKAEPDMVCEFCNELNRQEFNYVRYYLNEDNDVIVELNYCAFEDDIFTRVITPGMVARIAIEVDKSYPAFRSLENL